MVFATVAVTSVTAGRLLHHHGSDTILFTPGCPPTGGKAPY